MTAASPACSPASSSSSSTRSSHSSPACLPACGGHLRKSETLQTKLHLGSGPGVWLLLGVVVVMVGMSVAVAGYVSAAPKPAAGRGSTHVERMKLAGPMVMGVGLFIFICAATLLYENRDREVRRRETDDDDLEDLKGGSCWEDSQEQPSFSCPEQWECKDREQEAWAAPTHVLPLSDPPLPHPPHASNTNAGGGPSLPPPPTDAGGKYKEEADRKDDEQEGRSTLLARVLHHQEPSPHPPSPCLSISRSSVYSDSCNSSEINFDIWTDSPLPPQH